MKILKAFEMYRREYMLTMNRSYSTMSHFEYYRNELVKSVGDIEIEDLTVEEVVRFLGKLREDRCSNTVRNYAGAIRSVLRYCRLKGLDVVDYELIPIAKRVDALVDYVTPSEVRILIGAAQTLRAKFTIAFLWASGIRVSELCDVKKSDIRGRCFSVVGKGNKARVCFFDSRAEELMQLYLDSRDDDSPYLIVSNIYKTKVSKSTIEYIIRNVRQRAGLNKNITPHTFRHGFATNLLEHGVAIQDVSQMLGHASVQTTMIYRHTTNAALREKYEKAHSS